MCDRDCMTITPKPHERKGHYLPFVNKPPVSGQFLSCQLRQSMTNLSCFESRLWSVSSFNAPCRPYSLWSFISGSLKHDISPAESRKSSFSARSCAIESRKHEWEPIHGTVGQILASYAKILTSFLAQTPQQSCPLIHLAGNLEGRWPLLSWLLGDVTSAQLLSIVWRPRAGAVFQLGSFRAVYVQVASRLKALVVWERDQSDQRAPLMPAHLLPLSSLVALVFTRLSSVAFHLFADPFADEPSLPLIKTASIHQRGSIIFWQEDGDRVIPRSS